MATLKEHVTVVEAQDGSIFRVGNAFSLTAEQRQAAADQAGVEISDPGPLDAVGRAARQLGEYEEMTSSAIASELNKVAGMRPASLSEIGIEARENGAVEGEFGEAFSQQYSGYMGRFEGNLESGDYRAASMLVKEMPPNLKSQLSQATLGGIQAALDARTRRRVDLVAQKLGVQAPDPVEASDVDTALGR